MAEDQAVTVHAGADRREVIGSLVRRQPLRRALLALLLLLPLAAALAIATRLGEPPTRILALGDSYTYGAGIAPGDSYPAQLQRLLDGRAPGRYQVINLGAPGMNTTQLRNRLADNLARYRPDVALLWCGVNDGWNLAETAFPAPQPSRALRNPLLRWWLGLSVGTRRDGRHQSAESEWRLAAPGSVTLGRGAEARTYTGRPRLEIWTLRHGGGVERFEHCHGPSRSAAEMAVLVEEDLSAIVRQLRAAGISVFLLQYPRSLEAFGNANAAIARVAAVEGVPLIDTALALARTPEQERVWIDGLHPTAPIYREIASQLLAVLAHE